MDNRHTFIVKHPVGIFIGHVENAHSWHDARLTAHKQWGEAADYVAWNEHPSTWPVTVVRPNPLLEFTVFARDT